MNSVQMYSIHDRNRGLLAFDLKDILGALAPLLDRWTWHVGDDLETVSNAASIAEPEGKWLTSRELTEFANAIAQTIDGTFIAYPKELGVRYASDADPNTATFSTSPAELMIQAVDSSFFEVYAKDPRVTELLRHRFKDVREVHANRRS